jgi:7-cyano-7-deazaguanine synthase in queuosine biosynthesis
LGEQIEVTNRPLASQEPTNKVMVLASGGVDSALVMARLLKQGKDVYPVFGNYNQLAYSGEIQAVWEVVASLTFKILTEKWTGTIQDVIETHIDTNIGPIAACPGRVLAFVGSALIWAFTNDLQRFDIAIGIHRGDKDQDSCRVGYQDDLDKTVQSLTQGMVHIITPLMGMTREGMAEEIEELGIPWSILYNCYWETPCGYQSPDMTYRCPGCRRKQEAMRHVGRPESEWLIPNWNPGQCSDRKLGRRDWKYA